MVSTDQAKTRGGSPTRIERARIVRDVVMDLAKPHGRWSDVQVGAASTGSTSRLWTVDAGLGWTATVDTAFTRPTSVFSQADLYRSAALGLEIPEDFDQEISVSWDGFGKVMSIGRRGSQDILIGFVPGPWEAAFGLPARPWSPTVALRLAQRAV